jgi:amino acid transporter
VGSINRTSFGGRLKSIFIGKARDLSDQQLFHKVSLVALLAWVALGADGISSSCYGPEEAFVALGSHHYMSLFVALASVITIVVICASYSQIIEQFPAGGGGYLVASKLISPAAGVVAGCALLIDYVLTITVSIASGVDALFSLLPGEWHEFKLMVAIGGVLVLILLNLRGVKESVLVFLPIFGTFVITHLIAIGYAFVTHSGDFGRITTQATHEASAATSQAGFFGLFLLLLRAYSMGAGTYTGIEAVSNGLPMLREPRVETGKRTMKYMAVSLSVMVAGLLVAYLLFRLEPQQGKTLNAVLLERVTSYWPSEAGFAFILVTLASEAMLLFIAAQAGFIGGPQILANMALDRWFPSRFANLSDRFVAQNGLVLMGVMAIAVMFFSRGSVDFLVVLYSINVFITFSLSQFGMVRHWWSERNKVTDWRRKLAINGIGFVLTSFILISLSIIKFEAGGWITLLVTGLLICVAFVIKRHYLGTQKTLRRLDELVQAAESSTPELHKASGSGPQFDPKGKTAVIMVNGFNGLGLHTVLGIVRMFPGVFKNFVFVQVGVVDAGNFKGSAEIANLKAHVAREVDRYVQYMRQHGFYAEAESAIGTDVVAEVSEMAPDILRRYPDAVFFGGQLVFPDETPWSRILHNYAVFALQRRFYKEGLPLLILPIRV